jgi:hypothetical protein
MKPLMAKPLGGPVPYLVPARHGENAPRHRPRQAPDDVREVAQRAVLELLLGRILCPDVDLHVLCEHKMQPLYYALHYTRAGDRLARRERQ